MRRAQFTPEEQQAADEAFALHSRGGCPDDCGFCEDLRLAGVPRFEHEYNRVAALKAFARAAKDEAKQPPLKRSPEWAANDPDGRKYNEHLKALCPERCQYCEKLRTSSNKKDVALYGFLKGQKRLASQNRQPTEKEAIAERKNRKRDRRNSRRSK